MQTKQMDVIVRFWSEREGQVITEYLGRWLKTLRAC